MSLVAFVGRVKPLSKKIETPLRESTWAKKTPLGSLRRGSLSVICSHVLRGNPLDWELPRLVATLTTGAVALLDARRTVHRIERVYDLVQVTPCQIVY